MASTALAYSQVNDSFAGSFQAIKAHRGRLNKAVEQVCSASNAPTRGDGERAKTLPTEDN